MTRVLKKPEALILIAFTLWITWGFASHSQPSPKPGDCRNTQQEEIHNAT